METVQDLVNEAESRQYFDPDSVVPLYKKAIDKIQASSDYNYDDLLNIVIQLVQFMASYYSDSSAALGFLADLFAVKKSIRQYDYFELKAFIHCSYNETSHFNGAIRELQKFDVKDLKKQGILYIYHYLVHEQKYSDALSLMNKSKLNYKTDADILYYFGESLLMCPEVYKKKKINPVEIFEMVLSLSKNNHLPSLIKLFDIYCEEYDNGNKQNEEKLLVVASQIVKIDYALQYMDKILDFIIKSENKSLLNTMLSVSPANDIIFDKIYQKIGYPKAIDYFTDKNQRVNFLIYAATQQGEKDEMNEQINTIDKILNEELDDSTKLEVLEMKGIALDNLGCHEEAIECYNKMLELNSGYINALYNKALAYQDLEDNESSLKCYDEILNNINPYDSYALQKKIELLIDLEREEEVEELSLVLEHYLISEQEYNPSTFEEE